MTTTPGPGIGNRAVSLSRPGDDSLRALESAVHHAIALGNTPGGVLARVANGLTGEINGYRERLLADAMRNAAEPILELTQDEARAIIRARRADRDKAQS